MEQVFWLGVRLSCFDLIRRIDEEWISSGMMMVASSTPLS
ncbi:hypothetical protein MUK42_24159 [Musa troglodytarum]|uniref:Uncharacterized protein n=1 Tax=Musa troglodytarum TaxID=320322 RepID=A0A9E7K9L6_9LILI|nr:hypothetical protein MUK42_24159 [Musa troglodytarum]